jgi:hypothetical protein
MGVVQAGVWSVGLDTTARLAPFRRMIVCRRRTLCSPSSDAPLSRYPGRHGRKGDVGVGFQGAQGKKIVGVSFIKRM